MSVQLIILVLLEIFQFSKARITAKRYNEFTKERFTSPNVINIVIESIRPFS